MLDMLLGNATFSKLEHPSNALSPIPTKLLGSASVYMLVYPLNTLLAMLMTLSGIAMSKRALA